MTGRGALRRLDDRFAARGPLALLRDVPQLGLLVIAAIFLAASALAFSRRTPTRLPGRPGAAAAVAPTGSPGAAALATARVGPIDGTPVAGYIDAAKAELARRLARDPGESAYAVVDLAAYTSPTDAAAAVAAVPGLAPVRALARVSLKDQPTDVLEASIRALPADLLAAFAAQSERRREDAAELRRLAASIDGSSSDEMAFKSEYTTSAAAAQLESDAYGKNCACVFALVLTGRISALSTLAGRPGIRVVDVAPGGVAASVLAFVGLLPEQTTTVMPVAGPGPALPVPAGKSPAAPPASSPSK